MTTKRKRAARQPAAAQPSAAVLGVAALTASGANLATKTFHIAALNGSLRIRQMDAGASLDLQAFARANADKENRVELLALNLVRLMLINEDGSRMFNAADPEGVAREIDLLRGMNRDAFAVVLSECSKIAKLESSLADAIKN